MHAGSHGHQHNHNHNKILPTEKKEKLTFKQHLKTIYSQLQRLQLPIGLSLLTLGGIPIVFRRRISQLDIILLVGVTTILILFETLKLLTKNWISKMTLLRNGILKHTLPKHKSIKNVNLADRVTMLGVGINIILSVIKFMGGIAFHSAVLVADAGHSLSDLLSDFVTLWAVQVARLPPDDDHPYGHGKFESVGSLFLSLTLIATGLSVGTWSYDKMHNILTTQRTVGMHGLNLIAQTIQVPSWPALVLAAVSILSKEWLFQVTKRVGESLNSQILIANAWHHRSDSFSSILSLLSIAAAILSPGLLIADSAGGIFVAGMICLTGMEVLSESVKQLTDSSDEKLVDELTLKASAVKGVVGVPLVRARSVGSGYLVDATILTDSKVSTSTAQSIAERTRWTLMQSNSQIMDVMVRTKSEIILCPLLTPQQRSANDVETQIRTVLKDQFAKDITAVKRVTIHYLNSASILVEVLVCMNNFDEHNHPLSIIEVKNKANAIQKALLEDKGISEAEVQLDLTNDTIARVSNVDMLEKTLQPN